MLKWRTKNLNNSTNTNIQQTISIQLYQKIHKYSQGLGFYPSKNIKSAKLEAIAKTIQKTMIKQMKSISLKFVDFDLYKHIHLNIHPLTKTANLMIRPLIQAIYDYRMAFNQETNPVHRNNYKIHYIQASTILSVQNIIDKISNKHVSVEEAINQWNNQPKEQVNQTRDYKTRLDDIFISKNKNYFRKDYERSLSKDKIEDFRQSQRINQQYYHRPKEHINTFQHKYSDHQYKQQGAPHHHNQKDGYNQHHKEGNNTHYRQGGGYAQRYRNERY